jgi:hypothetical protein
MCIDRVRLLACHSLARDGHGHKKEKLIHDLDENFLHPRDVHRGAVYLRQACWSRAADLYQMG